MSGRATGADHVYLADVVADAGEKKVYFEVSDYATNYVFFENPR